MQFFDAKMGRGWVSTICKLNCHCRYMILNKIEIGIVFVVDGWYYKLNKIGHLKLSCFMNKRK